MEPNLIKIILFNAPQLLGLAIFFLLVIRALNKVVQATKESAEEYERLAKQYKKQLADFMGDLEARIKVKEERIKELEREVSGYEIKCKSLNGKRLFEYDSYYPIILNVKNEPSLDKKIFIKAVDYFLHKEDNKLAAADLVYLREDNLNNDEYRNMLKGEELEFYQQLIKKYDLEHFINELKAEDKEIFQNYLRLVEDIGKTLPGIKMEVLIHNIRNPIRSVIAIENADQVSGRPLHHCSTRYVYQFVKDYGRTFIRDLESGRKVSYKKLFNDGTSVKATTTPIYHRRYGLIGIFCLNIDIGAVNRMNNAEVKQFLANYVNIKDPHPLLIEELPKAKS